MSNPLNSSSSGSNKRPWYKAWWAALLFVLFLPITLPALALWGIWRKTPWPQAYKLGATALVVVFSMVMFAVAQSDDQSSLPTKPTTAVSTDLSSQGQITSTTEVPTTTSTERPTTTTEPPTTTTTEQLTTTTEAQVIVPQENDSNQNSSQAEGQFVGSIKSDKYHFPDCRAARMIYPENEIWFASSADAQGHGYIPCKICDPP